MALRRHDRLDFTRSTSWDFLKDATGTKRGYLSNISQSGCLLRTADPIAHHRPIRMMIKDGKTNICIALVGRAVRCESKIEPTESGDDVTIYRYGIEFQFPRMLANQDLDLIFALSSKNFSVRSCRSLNSKSSILPGFLA
jgi:hypothetical protein